MRAKHRELTEKYKAYRLQPSALFLSRITQTFFNKFTKKGKKALARHHMHSALTQLRMGTRRPVMHQVLLRVFRSLRLQFLLVARRKGRKIVDVPVPVRRNKRDVLNLQALYTTITRRTERKLSSRIFLELLSLVVNPRNSTIIRQQSAHLSRVYDERVNMQYR